MRTLHSARRWSTEDFCGHPQDTRATESVVTIENYDRADTCAVLHIVCDTCCAIFGYVPRCGIGTSNI
jgi:hypothetical protein